MLSRRAGNGDGSHAFVKELQAALAADSRRRAKYVHLAVHHRSPDDGYRFSEWARDCDLATEKLGMLAEKGEEILGRQDIKNFVEVEDALVPDLDH
jgi:hypothetical protein